MLMDLSLEPLLTGRLTLRPFRKRDAEPLLRAVQVSLPDLHEWLPWAHLAYGRADAVHFVRESMKAWRETRAYDFAIRRTGEPNLHLGNVSIWFVSRGFRTGEVGYWTRSDHTGQGIASEATARLVQVGFDELKMHRIVFRIAVGNRSSERVAEKLGFTREGILREELKIRNSWLDHTVFSLLDHEYERHRELFKAVVDNTTDRETT